MPRRELLTSTERLQLLAFPEDAGELIRLFTLSRDEAAFVRQHRGDHNRFGIAVLMAYLRYPGRILAKDDRPHDAVMNVIADQLQIPVAAWDLYADRDETRREHREFSAEVRKSEAVTLGDPVVPVFDGLGG